MASSRKPYFYNIILIKLVLTEQSLYKLKLTAITMFNMSLLYKKSLFVVCAYFKAGNHNLQHVTAKLVIASTAKYKDITSQNW